MVKSSIIEIKGGPERVSRYLIKIEKDSCNPGRAILKDLGYLFTLLKHWASMVANKARMTTLIS